MIKIFWDFTASNRHYGSFKGLSDDDRHASEKFKYSFNAKCKHTFWFLSALLSLYWLVLAFNQFSLLYEKSCCITTDSQVLWQQQVLGAFTTMQLSSNGNKGRSNEAIRQPYFNFFAKIHLKTVGRTDYLFRFFCREVRFWMINALCLKSKNSKTLIINIGGRSFDMNETPTFKKWTNSN